MMAQSSAADLNSQPFAGRKGDDSSLLWWLGAGLLLCAVVLAYAPALRGGLVWDDAAHVTRPELQSWHGLYRIWFELGATQQYYPLLHSAFWLQHRLWVGDSTLGYHLVNLSLHFGAALLFGLILRRLAVPGAFLAMAIFALHPVHVESVAWITELKNVLSGVFYLGAALAYLHFDERRGKLAYALALGLFVLALLSKTVTATLPAALLVVFWWQRGRLSWQRDVLPLAPFFLLGAMSGLFTAGVERKLVGAEGGEFQFTLVERCLIAGRAISFYLGKLAWPADLIFIYPRWDFSQRVWWQYIYPLGALGLMVGLWLYRKRSRAPLAAALLFCGTLFPVLGFFNVYPFRYSFVADHFQYLASLGIIALFAAGAATLLARWGRNSVQAQIVLGCVVAGVLGTLSWRQCRQYADEDTLYRETIARNPACWLATNNLGNRLQLGGHSEEAVVLLQQALASKSNYAEAHNNLGNALQSLGNPREAVRHYQQAVQNKPDYAEAHNNWGTALEALRDPQAAIGHFQEAVRIKPNYADAHNNWANALNMLGRPQDAMMHCQRALKINPDYAEAHSNLGNALNLLGRPQEAASHCREALRLQSNYAEAYLNLGNALNALGRPQEAINQYNKALRIKPSWPEALNNMGNALYALQRYQESAARCEEALQIEPDYVAAHVNYGNSLYALGRNREALKHYEIALRLSPNDAEPHKRLAWLWATCPEDRLRDGQRALLHAKTAASLSGGNNISVLESLAAANAEAGDFQEAVRWQEQALRLASVQHTTASQQRLELYQSGQPFRETLQCETVKKGD